jgi:hypothetical protein
MNGLITDKTPIQKQDFFNLIPALCGLLSNWMQGGRSSLKTVLIFGTGESGEIF